jgi:hypothetical protein
MVLISLYLPLKPITMKKLALTVMLVTLLPAILLSQDQVPVRRHEIGFTFSSLNNFGMIYKTGRSNTLFRASVLSLNLAENKSWGRTEDSLSTRSSNFGAVVSAGFERRVNLVEHLQFAWGAEGGVAYTYNKSKSESNNANATSTQWTLRPTLSFVLGACYTIKEHIVLSAEIYPYFGYAWGKQKTENSSNNSREVTTSNFVYGLNSGSARLTVAYRFWK